MFRYCADHEQYSTDTSTYNDDDEAASKNEVFNTRSIFLLRTDLYNYKVRALHDK